MDIKELEPGQQAPDDSNHVIVHRMPNGKFRFEVAAWTGGTPQLGVHQRHGMNLRDFDTSNEARDAGIEFAEKIGPLADLIIEYRDAEEAD